MPQYHQNHRIFQEEADEFRKKRQFFWSNRSGGKGTLFNNYYHQRIADIYNNLIPPDSTVLEIGCGSGRLLKKINGIKKYGVDFISPLNSYGIQDNLITYQVNDAANFTFDEIKFDYIILSDLVNDLWDVQSVFDNIQKHCKPETRFILNYHSNLWALPLRIFRKLGLATPLLPQNWLTKDDINNFLLITKFSPLHTWQEIILPFKIPLITKFLNRYLVKISPLNHLGLTNFTIARPSPSNSQNIPSVSVIIAARNEAGHISDLLNRIPKMGSKTEIIFVEGNSSDNTYEVIEDCINKTSREDCFLFRQTGKGKGDAVRLGFEKASGDILMILDADITVPPEDLPRFYEVIKDGTGEFINGVRLVYPMEEKAMRFLNLIGNKFFTWAFSWLLSQPIRDTLCGTKVLWRHDYKKIVKGREYFGDFDPFGDFDLLFGAAKLNLKILEIPIRYRARKYGETNISRWSHGWLLLKMVVFAARKIKFI